MTYGEVKKDLIRKHGKENFIAYYEREPEVDAEIEVSISDLSTIIFYNGVSVAYCFMRGDE